MMPDRTDDASDPGLVSEPRESQLRTSTECDDAVRYIQYLQQQQLAEGWDQFFRDASRGPDEALISNVLQMVATTLGEPDERLLTMAREMLTAPIELRTAYENRATEIRYKPILDEVIEAAIDLGIPAVRPIDLATSTDISCTPMALPTEDRHLLFAGEGTARFCNYWTKAISRSFFTLRALPSGLSQAEWDSALTSAKPSGVLLAALFATKYAFHGTMLEFGRIPNIPEETDWRAALLHAMLLFSVAHEYAHFVFYENDPETRGMLSEEKSKDLEFKCDRMAIRISTQAGKKWERVQIRTGLGALAFYCVMSLCQDVKDLYGEAGKLSTPNASNNHVDTHPALNLRIDAIVDELLNSVAVEEQETLRTFLNGFLAMLNMMQRLTVTIVTQAIVLHSQETEQA
jgi:hypothetical protein